MKCAQGPTETRRDGFIPIIARDVWNCFLEEVTCELSLESKVFTRWEEEKRVRGETFWQRYFRQSPRGGKEPFRIDKGWCKGKWLRGEWVLRGQRLLDGVLWASVS